MKKKKKQLSPTELASIFQQTALLFQSGISPAEGMEILKSDTASVEGREIFDQIISVCKKGHPFHEALASTELFPNYVIHMVELGELSGSLEKVMFSLAAYYEKQESISYSIRSAITYPLLMIGMMLLIILVLLSQVLPVFNRVFEELGSSMTGAGAFLLSIGSSLNRYSLLLTSIMALLGGLFVFVSKTESGYKWMKAFLQRFPPTRHFYWQLAGERFASGMALALGSGMDTYSTLEMLSNLVNHPEMSKRIAFCRKNLEQGNNLADTLVASGIFNQFHSRMLSVGFRSGNIDTVISQIANRYSKETDRRVQSLISILEPTLVIILSVIVGMILLSVILPLMGIMTSIG